MAIDMLFGIFNGYEGKPTKRDEHQAKIETTPKAKEDSNIEED